MSPHGGIAPITGPPAATGGPRAESGGFRADANRDLPRTDRSGPIDFANAAAVADSVLYDRYRLHTYAPRVEDIPVRGTTGAWRFGVLAPRCWIETRAAHLRHAEGISGSVESWWNRTECLVRADLDSLMEVRLRYLQLSGDPGTSSARSVVPREATVAFMLGELVGCGIVVTVDGGDRLQARFLVSASVPASRGGLYKVMVRVENAMRLDDGEMDWEAALGRSLISAHLLLGVEAGSFLSLIDPPDWARGAVDTCRNVRAFPVLAGPGGTDGIVLSAPIILYDHPQTAADAIGYPTVGDATETIA